MCFTNLPIDFDSEGHAHLDQGSDFGLATVAPKVVMPPMPRPPPSTRRTTELNIEPVTRVAGALAFHTTVDLEAGVVTEAHSEAIQFRGYELILQGRNPVEAIDISSRACGVCGGVHSTCAAMTLEMVFGVPPPPLAIVARNVAEAAELFYDHCLHHFLLAGPDYSEEMIRPTNPALWKRAERALAPGSGIHGMATVGEIMSGLNPLTGALYREALAVTRSGREIVSLLFGKYPHPSTIVPAGLARQVDQHLLNQVLARVLDLRDYAKKVAAMWEDLVSFFLESDARYAEVGARTPNLIAMGMWDDPWSYDASYLGADEWGANRLSTPGVVVDGTLRTTKLNQINTGIEEFVDHSFYEDWTDGLEAGGAPDGSPLSPYHPWNKRTIPRPEARSWKDRYSWATAPRWDREPMEAGPLARQWVTATAGLVQTDFIRSGEGSLDIHIPKGELPETVVHWRVPGRVNALERNRARATHVGYCLMVAYSCLLQGFDLVRSGETAMSTPFEVTDGVGVGYWEGGRGALTHHCKVEDGKLSNYQIVTPSTWMASPRDAWGVAGPYEEAVLNTPILEETDGSDELVGIDVLRTIRSFDPCLPCAVHMHAGDSTLVRDATTCACGLE